MPVDERVARSVALEQAYVHDVYEQFYDNPRSKPWPKVQEFLDDLEPGSLVCDVGCGNGKYLNVNTSIFNIGGDKSTRLCEMAREKENEVLVLDNLALPFRDESLDAVISIAVVHHLATAERRIRALKELARVLRIGGRLIISVWAMEQSHRKFESQDVLVPWHRPKHLSTPSLELTSTTNTSEDDFVPAYHAYTQTSDSDSNNSMRLVRKKGKGRHKGRSIDPGRNSSPSSSSLSSPNETCYSFVRRALQKLAGSRRVGVHRPWFLESWSKPVQNRGCEYCDCMENAQDLPIELRRVDEDDLHSQRRQTFPSSQLINDIANTFKSKSMTNIKTVEDNNNASIPEIKLPEEVEASSVSCVRSKPKLVKQKKSICEEDEEEALDQPTDMKNLINNLPEYRVNSRAGVLKQRSLNEELMSADRLKEKERLRQNIQKQTSLNEDLIYSFKDSFFSVSTSKRFQLIKSGFTNKIKNSTTIEKVTGTSIKNGFVRMFQNWKSTELEPESVKTEEKTKESTVENAASATTTTERRHSKEDGSDSSKDSSLQSDTSVDSEDSFASVIFVPKSDPMSPTPLSPGPISPCLKNTPRIKQSSCPTSPRIKQMPLAVYPLTKQLSSPKPSTSEVPVETTIMSKSGLAQKYSVAQIPKFRRTSLNTPDVESDSRTERLKKIKELLSQKPGFGTKTSKNFPIVRHSSVTNGKVEAVAKSLPKLLSLELFNPETDDKDSDSSCVSSPDSMDSVINVRNESKTKFKFPPRKINNLLEAAAEVASTLDVAVDKVIGSKRKLKSNNVLSIIHRYSNDTTPLLTEENSNVWDEECHKHLTDFADKLSEKILQEIDQYQEKSHHLSADNNIDVPYIHRLSEELDDLSKLSAEIQKQNEYLAKLDASDSLFSCVRCKENECKCKKKRGGRSNHVAADGLLNKSHESLEVLQQDNSDSKLAVNRAMVRMGTSIDSCDSDKGSSTNSIMSSVATSLNFGPSIESGDGFDSHKDTTTTTTSSMSRYSGSEAGSTASLASCPEWKNVNRTKTTFDSSTTSLESDSLRKRSNYLSSGERATLLSDTSQDSLPSDNIGGEITYHRYYHVFREGELDQLIEKYVENLHIISSYYDHASWCIIAEKVQVWTI